MKIVFFILLLLSSSCTHRPPCREVATNASETCSGPLTESLPYAKRKEVLATLAKNPTSTFEVIYNKIPVQKLKTVRSSTAQDVAHELNSIDLKALARRDILVYLDIDDTILEQWAPYFIDGYHSLTIREDDKVNWHIAIAPGLEKLIQTIRSLNGGIILYSRNYLRRVEALADLVPVMGRPLRESVDGVLSEPYVKDGRFKDLNVVRHPNAIILEDSPDSVLLSQRAQVLALEKFKPDVVNIDQGIIAATTPIQPGWINGFMDHHRRKMDKIIQNLQKAHSQFKKEKIPFLEAFRPYSYAEK